MSRSFFYSISQLHSVKIDKYFFDIFLILGFLLVSIFMPFLKPGLYILLFVYCLAGPEGIIKALTLSWVLVTTTQAFGDTSGIGILKSLLPFLALVSLVMHWVLNPRLSPPIMTLWIVAFGLLVVALGAMTAYALDVSILKAVLFTTGLVTIFWAMKFAVNNKRIDAWFISLFLCIIFVSIPFSVTSAGYFVNGFGFQGIFKHPQIMGAFAGISTAWLFSKVVMNHDTRPLYLVALGLAVILLFLSAARVGLFTAIFGIIFAFLFGSKAKAKISTLVFIYVGFCALLFASIFFNIGDPAEDFVRKKEDQGSIVESVLSSRMPLVLQSWTNFQESPYFGIGFGLASNPAELKVQYDPLLGIPISASVEKGVFFVAVLEEIGLVGTLVFFIILGFLFARIYYSGNPELMALFIAPIATNFGDATLFSLGDNGLLIWLMIIYAYSKARQVSGRKYKRVKGRP